MNPIPAQDTTFCGKYGQSEMGLLVLTPALGLSAKDKQ